MAKSNDVYFVVYDSPAGHGWIDKRRLNDIWQANLNECGWTYQDVERHGSIYGRFDNRKDAEAHLAKL